MDETRSTFILFSYFIKGSFYQITLPQITIINSGKNTEQCFEDMEDWFKSSRQNASKITDDWDDIITHFDLTDTYNTLLSTTLEYTFFHVYMTIHNQPYNNPQ